MCGQERTNSLSNLTVTIDARNDALASVLMKMIRQGQIQIRTATVHVDSESK